MKKNNLLIVMLLSIITFFSGCSVDAIYFGTDKEGPEAEHDLSEKLLPTCIITESEKIFSFDNTTYQHFKYDTFDRIVEINRVSTLDTLLTVISYGNDFIKVVKSDSKYPEETEVKIYRYEGSMITIEGESPIYMDKKQQVTSYINKTWVGEFNINLTYDENGNAVSYTYHPWHDERTNTLLLKYDDKNGIFRHVKTPSWFLVTQIGGDIAYQNLYNNCIAYGEASQMNENSENAYYGYQYTYNSAGYPLEISQIPGTMISNSYLGYKVLYNDTEVNPPIDPAPPVNTDSLNISAIITTEEGYTGEIFAGKAIRSFNPETREIVFSNYNILANLNELAPIQLKIFRGKDLLFSATVIASDAPHTVNDLVFLIDVAKHGNVYYPGEHKYYFLDGYPALDELTDNKEKAEQLREENARNREEKWNIFLDCLTDLSDF